MADIETTKDEQADHRRDTSLENTEHGPSLQTEFCKSEVNHNTLHIDLAETEPGQGPDDMGGKSSSIVAVTQLTPTGGDFRPVPVSDLSSSGAVKKDQDDLQQANGIWTTDPKGAVRLRMSDTGIGALKPLTLMTVFKTTVSKSPDHVALAVKRGGQWIKWTFKRYYEEVRTAAKSLIKLGLEPGHGVGIIGFNSPEWYIGHLGTIWAGGLSAGIYTTNSPEACHYVAKDCQANVIIVENHAQLTKILKVWDQLPDLKAVVQYTGDVAERRDNVYSWNEFMSLSKEVSDADLEARLATQAPNGCCSCIYTSGTTGDPKAVMLSHDNVTWTSEILMRRTSVSFGTEVLVSYLPLSHIAAQLMDLYIPLKGGFSVYFAQPDALKGSLVETWKEVRPTTVFGVPRVWEKIMEKLLQVGRQNGTIKRKVAEWAKRKGLQGTYAQMEGESKPFGWGLANVIFKKIHVQLGLDRCTKFSSGAAPITKTTLDYFASLNIPLLEVYGMSECCGPQAICTPEEFRLTSVGKELPGTRMRLENMDEDGNGEICYWGRHVFMGYMNKAEKTEEAISSDGWLRSGDVGKLDKDKYLYITGRIKELLITAGGENIAPVPIEDRVKEELPVVSNCMLIGDKKKFLSMLITIKSDVDPNTMEPQNSLAHDSVSWSKSHGSEAVYVSEVLADSVLLKAIQEGVDRVNKRAVSRATYIQKWSILPKDFSIPGGELGPTMKLRRPIVLKMYENTINALYEE